MICRRSRTSPPAARRGRSAMSSGCRQEFPNAQPALGYGLTETNAAGCANYWGNYAAKPASTGRAQSPFVELAILGEGDRHLAVRRSRRDRASAPPPTSNAIGAIPRRPPRCSPPTDMFAPATSATSTRTAICSSSTARRKSSSAAARISRRPRSKRNATPVPRVAEVVGVRSARRAARRSAGRDHPLEGRRALERSRAFAPSSRRGSRSSRSPSGSSSRRALAAAGHRQDRPPRPEGAVRALKLDRRTLLIGGGAGVGLIVAFALWPRHLAQRPRRAAAASRRSAITSRSRATAGSRSRCRRSRPARASGRRCRKSSPTNLARRGKRSRSSRRR